MDTEAKPNGLLRLSLFLAVSVLVLTGVNSEPKENVDGTGKKCDIQ